jgi:hypothetical protein
MPGIELHLVGDGAFQAWKDSPRIDCGDMPIVACLEGGMQSGRGSVVIGLRLPGGGLAYGQTSALAFLTAALAVAAKFPGEATEVGMPQRANAGSWGVCRVCGCTDLRACADGCSWANPEHTLCSRCAAAGAVFTARDAKPS